MPLLRLIFLSFFANIAMCGLSEASIVDTPKFEIKGLVIVWVGETSEIQATAPTAKIGSSINVTSAARVQTASLRPIAPIGEVVLNRVSSASSTFYVASNTAFNIDAELEASETFPAATRASTSFELSVDRQGHGPLSFGSHAQLPHSQGAHAGIAADVKTLNDITSRRTVFTGDQRTAARPGSIAEQSVRFTTHLENSAASQANILLTVYVP